MQGLQRVHTAYFSMAVVFVALVVSSGCAVPGYNERSAMLFEDELHTEVKFGVFTPNSDHFSEGEGSGIGIKVGYEYEYGMHFGFEIQAMDDVQGAPYSGPGVLGNAEEMRLVGEGALASSDRRAITLNFDWDVPLAQDGSLPYLRYGVGVGGLYSKNTLSVGFLDAVNAGGGALVNVTNQLMFLVSPRASVRWDTMGDSLTFFVEGSYDIASHDLILHVDGDGDKAGEVDYGGFNGFVGVDFSF